MTGFVSSYKSSVDGDLHGVSYEANAGDLTDELVAHSVVSFSKAR